MATKLVRSFLIAFVFVCLTYFANADEKEAARQKAIGDVFKKADLNKDGKWSFAEYLQRDENLIKFERERFAEHDTNKDNLVSLAERRAFFKKQIAAQLKREKAAAAAAAAATTKAPKPKRKSTAAATTTKAPKPKGKSG